jgi:putative SOS response-associated peptidase YedK
LTNDPSICQKLINARAETVDEKASFKTCLQRKRCLIVADGFYEWKKEGSTKRPHRITLKSQELFGFAGLWDTWRSPTGEIVNSCSIITTTPNEVMEPIHNRMPVILPRDVEQVWLDPGITDSTFLKSLLVPYPADLMTAYEVSTLVNSPKNNGPECLVAVGDRLF